MTESSDGGASRASKIGTGTFRLASDIEINDFIDLSGKPCRVVDLRTERGLCHFRTINILTGNIVRSIVPPSTQFVIPDVSRDIYLLKGISYKDDSATLLHNSGAYTRDDIFLPQNENLRTMMVDGFNDDKRVFVGIVTSLGQDAVDVFNQSKTNDSDVVFPKNVGFGE